MKKWKRALARLEELAPVLARVLSDEVEHGNEVLSADLTTWGTRLPGEKACVAVRLRDAVRRRVRWGTGLVYGEEWDPHYTVGAGVYDERTGCRVEGPPWVLTQLRPHLQKLTRDLASGRYAAIARTSRGRFGAEALEAALATFGRPVVPPAEVFDDRFRGRTGAPIIRPWGGGTCRVYFYLWFDGAPSGLTAILDARARGGRVAWSLLDVTNGLDAFEPGERADAETISAVVLSRGSRGRARRSRR